MVLTDLKMEGTDGIAVLRRFYSDSAADGLDFAVQLLGLTGRLQDVDLIRASLTSSNGRDRANAIEALEQSCSHGLFRQIQPLLDLTNPDGNTEGDRPPQRKISREEVLRRASASSNALECAAAVLSFGASERTKARDLVQRRIAGHESPDVTATFAALLPYFESDTAGAGRVGLNPVERVAVFVAAPYFQDARIAALEYLASRSLEQSAPDGSTLYSPKMPTGSLIVVADGVVEVGGPGSTRRLGRGGTCNERSLMGTITSDECAISRGATVLAIPGATVARAIEIFPALGISLYRAKLVNGGAS
jgi:CheY-like chemotaxis protein